MQFLCNANITNALQPFIDNLREMLLSVALDVMTSFENALRQFQKVKII